MEASDIHIHFNQNSKIALNICLAIVMLSVAIELKPEHFQRLLRKPFVPLVGIVSHFLVLPLITLGLIWLTRPREGFALGMLLVAACPGGNIANFMASIARANTALSVSLTATSEVLAIVMTPFTFFFWSQWLPHNKLLTASFALDPINIIATVMLIIGIPLIIGMLLQYNFSQQIEKLHKPAKVLSLLILIAFIVFAVLGNRQAFQQHLIKVIGLVVLHNLVALFSGYVFARLCKLKEADSRTVALQTGIQNSGLGLVLIFNFFNGNGDMAIIAATWGIWHIVSGLSLANYWSYRTKKLEERTLSVNAS
ncbi:MAG: bile acid:sodium symporter family protein [Chitinophagales bacterium]|nr:bile acid:sodium symporter family protein [Chitinophagales bacterium]